MTGRIRVWDPPRVFEHEWSQPVLTDTESGVVRYELAPDGDGTLLRFSHRGLSRHHCRRGLAHGRCLAQIPGVRRVDQWTR